PRTSSGSTVRTDPRATPGPSSSRSQRTSPRLHRRTTVARASIVFSFWVPQGRCLIEQELADQLFEHDGPLRLRDPAAVAEHLRLAARFKADVNLAKKSRRENRRDRILAELITVIDAHRDDRLIRLGVEADAIDATDDDAGRFHRRAQLEAADV